MEILENTEPQSGDVFRAVDGVHIGTIDISEFDRTRHALHLQVLVGGVWYIYKLEGIEILGEENGVEAISKV